MSWTSLSLNQLSLWFHFVFFFIWSCVLLKKPRTQKNFEHPKSGTLVFLVCLDFFFLKKRGLEKCAFLKQNRTSSLLWNSFDSLLYEDGEKFLLSCSKNCNPRRKCNLYLLFVELMLAYLPFRTYPHSWIFSKTWYWHWFALKFFLEYFRKIPSCLVSNQDLPPPHLCYDPS